MEGCRIFFGRVSRWHRVSTIYAVTGIVPHLCLQRSHFACPSRITLRGDFQTFLSPLCHPYRRFPPFGIDGVNRGVKYLPKSSSRFSVAVFL
jgi:hypothetical protein